MQYYLAIGTDNRAERMPGIYETEDSAIMAAKRETEKLSPADERFIRVIEDTPMGLVVYATKAQQQARLTDALLSKGEPNPAPGVGTTIDHLYLNPDRQPDHSDSSESAWWNPTIGDDLP